jgi:hypothetical protein
MNNYYGNIDGNNYDSINKLLLIVIFFFGHILFYYASYKKYKYLTYEDNEIFTSELEESLITEPIKEESTPQLQLPYEEKYMSKLLNMKNEYVFTKEELEFEKQKLDELKQEENNKKLESTYVLNEKIEELTSKLIELNDEYKDNRQSNKDESLVTKLYDSIQNEINLNKKQLFDLQEKVVNNDDLKEKARQYIIDEQLKKFKKNYVIEHTPLGNVLMFYNHDKLAFEYYSDSTIPYRYLETVARKYVLTYNYRPLYIDMNEELKEYEKKLQEKEENDKTKISNSNTNTKSKDVFAKFKSYNKEAGTGRINTAPPPKNSIPQNRLTNANFKDNKKDNNGNSEKILLKEKANRYSYQGKFLNFNILQKIDKKVVDKKYALTFADFKKMKNIKSN